MSPELAERGVEEDVAVGGIGSEEVERGVAGGDDGDGTGEDCRAVGSGGRIRRILICGRRILMVQD